MTARSSFGLWSNRSICDGAAGLEQVDDPLRLRGEVRQPGRAGRRRRRRRPTAVVAEQRRQRRRADARPPCGRRSGGGSASELVLLGDRVHRRHSFVIDLVQVQDHAGRPSSRRPARPGRASRPRSTRRRRAASRPPAGRRANGRELRSTASQQDSPLLGRRAAAGDQPEGVARSAPRRRRPPSRIDPLRPARGRPRRRSGRSAAPAPAAACWCAAARTAQVSRLGASKVDQRRVRAWSASRRCTGCGGSRSSPVSWLVVARAADGRAPPRARPAGTA